MAVVPGLVESVTETQFVLEVENAESFDGRSIRSYLEQLESPSPRFRRWLQRIDPRREAIVLGMPALSVSHLDGRVVADSSHGAFKRIEDKVLLQEDLPDLFPDTWSGSLDEFLLSGFDAPTSGTSVITTDGSSGFQHASEATFVMRPGSSELFLKEIARFGPTVGLRVMPLYRGRPIGVDVIVGRSSEFIAEPVEHLTFMTGEDSVRLLFAGATNVWVPSKGEMLAIEDEIRRVISSLRHRYGFLGPATIDGVLTNGRLRVTEINSRWQGSHQLAARGFESFDFHLYCSLIRLPEISDVGVMKFSRWYSSRARDRYCHLWLRTMAVSRGSAYRISYSSDGYSFASTSLHVELDTEVVGAASWLGDTLRIVLEPRHLGSRSSAAAGVVRRVLQSADAALNLGLPDLVPIHEGAING